MKLQSHNNKLETNAESETQDFGIGDASVVIEILRNRLYQNKVQTLVQEYICNARDAMREIGKGNDFHVTVPTRLNPVFKVRDFGPGITPDRMANVFVKYGSSTKRSSNNQTGGFGLGAKSAWSYTDSFSIVTHVDGIKRSYVAHTGVNNQGRLDLVSSETTDEPNGTEIQIAVKSIDMDEFRRSIARAVYFWNEKPQLKGELDPPTLLRGYALNDHVEFIDSMVLPEYIPLNEYDTSGLAVIDGIPYTITRKLVEKCKSLDRLVKSVKKKIILHIGNGLLEVSASRESIADSLRTVNALEAIAKRTTLDVKTHVTEKFSEVKSAPEYFKTYKDLTEYFNVDSFANYNDYTIVSDKVESILFKKLSVVKIHCEGRYGYKMEKISREVVSENRKGVYLKDLNTLFFMSTTEKPGIQRKRLKEFFKTKTHLYIFEAHEQKRDVKDDKGNITTETLVSLADSQAALDTIKKDFSLRDFTSIAYVDPPKEKKPKVEREDEEFCLHRLFNGQRHYYTTLAKNDDDWLYITMKDGSWGDYNTSDLRDLAWHLRDNEDLKVCGVSEKVLKTIEGDKHFSPLKDWLDNYKPTKDSVQVVKKSSVKNWHSIEILAQLKGVKDKFLTEMVKEYVDLSKLKNETDVPAMLANRIKALPEFKEFEENDVKLTTLLENQYPLISESGRYMTHIGELTVYINAKFERVGNAN